MRSFETALRAALPDYLQSQRWFGGKGRAMTAARLVDLVWLPTGAQVDVLVFVEVVYAGADAERYCLWLGLRDTPGEPPPIAELEGADPARWVVDATLDARGLTGLLEAVAQSVPLPTAEGGALRFADVTPEAAATLANRPAVRALGADQSNTSIRVGDTLVFKLLRRQQAGENPELEMTRFLTRRTTFRAVPALEGSITYAAPDGTESTLGVLQAWVDSVGDGWTYVLANLARELARPGSWPSAHEELGSLGATTFAFHEASASAPALPAFSPTPVGADDVARWAAEVSACAGRGVECLRRGATRGGEMDRLFQALERIRSHDGLPVPRTEGADAAFAAIRIHGDYHLGQTLRTSSGFVLIDFEGEPARPLEERRRKHCALKDVAGMLRSFEYAVAVACEASPERDQTLRTSLAMEAAFLDGYFGAAERSAPVFLPASREVCLQWIRFFELEKAAYELEYELNNRPAWARIPAGGILRLLDV